MMMEASSANNPSPSRMPKNQPTMPQATLLRRSGRTTQPWGASGPVLACISISDDSIMVKLLLFVACVVVCLCALLYQTYYVLRQTPLAISHHLDVHGDVLYNRSIHYLTE